MALKADSAGYPASTEANFQCTAGDHTVRKTFEKSNP